MGGSGSSHKNYTRPISASGLGSINNDDCDNINIITDLQNIQSSIKDYKVGDSLDVELEIMETITVSGEYGLCGNVTSTAAQRLINCLKKGRQFEATIISIDVLSCRVRIRPKE